MSFDQHLNALQTELQQLHSLMHQHKEKIEELKQDQKAKQVQMSAVLEGYQSCQQEMVKHQKMIEKYNHLMAQYIGQIPQEAQLQLTAEFEKVKQSLQPPDAQQQLAQNMMGNLAMGGMPLPAMMALQAQAQMGRGMMQGMPPPTSRVQKSNGLHNGIPGMPPGMTNGLTAQLAAMQAQMAAAAGMPAGMAQLQQMAAFSNMQAMGAMPFNPAQLAAMQSMGLNMNSMMLPPISAANSAAALAGMGNPIGLSVSTPSRNPSNGGPLSGTRTPQSAPSNGVNSPRATIKEEPAETKKDDAVRSPSEDTVAVA